MEASSPGLAFINRKLFYSRKSDQRAMVSDISIHKNAGKHIGGSPAFAFMGCRLPSDRRSDQKAMVSHTFL
eukprot:988057-Pelagomonas_calceolata.AAC.2